MFMEVLIVYSLSAYLLRGLVYQSTELRKSRKTRKGEEKLKKFFDVWQQLVKDTTKSDSPQDGLWLLGAHKGSLENWVVKC